MKRVKRTVLILLLLPLSTFSQSPDEGELGAWYMYFFNSKFKNGPWGIQGDYQYRDWSLMGDMEQLLLRTGLTFTPKETNVTFTAGYGNITSQTFGDGTNSVNENRIYQEMLLPQKVGTRFNFVHRFRYEQRFVDGQDFRTRYRYNLFLNVPLNKKSMEKKALHLALYNEIFINGQEAIGDGRTVQLFDRNRTYLGLGYVLNKNLRVQLGWMNQKTTNWGKGQLQFSLHHTFQWSNKQQTL